jgi:hypothetical protein
MAEGHSGLTKVIDLVIQSNGAVVVFCEGGCDTSAVGIDAISFRVGKWKWGHS